MSDLMKMFIIGAVFFSLASIIIAKFRLIPSTGMGKFGLELLLGAIFVGLVLLIGPLL